MVQVATEHAGSAAAMKGLTMPKDDATLSAASAGSHNTDMATARLSAANTWLQEEIKRLSLTDEEREAVCQAITAYDGNDDDEECARIAATLRSLLERTK